jgi:hypothetical protein
MRRILIPILSVLFLLTGCSCNKEPDIDSKFLESTAVGLQIKGTTLFSYDIVNDQLGYNELKRQFRACNDTGTEYFTLTCDKLPTEKGQTVKGSLTYTRGNGVGQESNLKLKVEKVQGDLVWLWNSDKQIAICVRTLR